MHSSTLSLTSALDRVGGQGHATAALSPRKREPVPIVQESGWAPGLVWTGADSLAPYWASIPGPPSPRQSLYRLSYPGL